MTLLLTVVLLLAQDPNAPAARSDLTLQGRITDQTSAMIPGVVVSLRHPDGMLWISSNESGQYSFQGLRPGKYQIQSDLPGFLRDSQRVDLTASMTVDVTLKVQSQSISIGPGVSSSSVLGPTHSEPIAPQYAIGWSDVPPWFAFVKGFKFSGNGPPVGWLPKQPTDIGIYNLEVVSRASVADVAAFYREVMKLHELVIESEGPQTDTSYSFHARTKDRAHEVNLNVLRLSAGGDTIVRLTDRYTLPKE
jgi:hypothetical protein